MSSAAFQISSFSSIIGKRRLQLHSGSYPCRIKFCRSKVYNVLSSNDRGTEIPNLENKSSTSYAVETSVTRNEDSLKSNPEAQVFLNENTTNGQVVNQPKRGAMIHDFCLGIPFGALVLCGGVVGFIFSRNPATLGTGVLLGGSLLVLSTLSLKVWKQGKSSLPFMLGQAVISIALLWKNVNAYQLTQKIIPTGFNVALSAAMLCFYSYVVLSGGNPPPKKSKYATTVESSL